MFRQFSLGLRVGERRIGRFLVSSMAIGFVALIVAGLAAAWSTARNEDYTGWVNHTYEVELAIAQTQITIEQGETTRRGYLLTGQQIYLDTYRNVTRQLPTMLRRIHSLSRDNPVQQANSRRLQALVADLSRQRERTLTLTATGRRAAAIAVFGAETSARRMRAIRDLFGTMTREEQRLLAIRDQEQRASVAVFYWTLGLAGLLLVLVAVISLATVLRFTRDLAASRDDLRDFADSLEEQVDERTADLIRANDEIQRFAYIVSHDLRAPLVNVMGFTAELEAASVALDELIERAERIAPEIVTEEARTAAREDLPEAIGFIRTSTQKMDRLIAAILKLSREGRRVLTAQRIDMTDLVETIGATLSHVLGEREATLSVEPMPDLVSDRLAIEQIFSNLVENAVKYLQPGRPGRIVVRGARVGGRLVYEIEDNGRGIAAADHSRIFDLFRRSGVQDQPGEGIGLAHVRALAYRLGGVIDVSSELGKGTIFRLTLPPTLSEPQGTPA